MHLPRTADRERMRRLMMSSERKGCYGHVRLRQNGDTPTGGEEREKTAILAAEKKISSPQELEPKWLLKRVSAPS